MRKVNFFTLIIVTFATTVQAQIANSYPNDVGIELDENVLYVEKFDDELADIFNRYEDIKNAAGMSLDSDVPEGSLGPSSLKMTRIQGANDG